MKTLVALFRGINVGGRNILPMKQLVSLLEDFGCQHVRTYIQSGNVVFQSSANSASGLAGTISSAIKKDHGFEPQILVLEAADIRNAILDNPFPNAVSNPKTLHIGFFFSAPKNPDLEKLEVLKTNTEGFVLKEAVFYLHAPEGIGRSKLAVRAEKLIGVSITGRNWRTVCKLNEMAEELEAQ